MRRNLSSKGTIDFTKEAREYSKEIVRNFATSNLERKFIRATYLDLIEIHNHNIKVIKDKIKQQQEKDINLAKQWFKEQCLRHISADTTCHQLDELLESIEQAMKGGTR